MNIKRLLKSFLIVMLLAGSLTTLLFLIKALVLMFPTLFKYLAIAILTIMISSPFVAVVYTMLKKLDK
jgi:hypothetical protein